MNRILTWGIPQLLLIILFSALLWGSQYFFRDLWEPDEARYTYVAQEMEQSDSFFIPYRNGELYSHKPPLMFWLIRFSTLFTGGQYNGISGRLPTLLGIILSLIAISRITALWYDEKTAFNTLLILSTSFLFWHKGGTGQIDMLLLGLQLSALYCLFKNDIRPSYRLVVAAFCSMGLAILAKGPVGLIVPIGIYIFFSLFTKDYHHLKKWHWIWGTLIALVFPLGWLFMAKINGAPTAYFKELLFDQNVGRVSGSFGGHYRPFYYYIKYLLVDFMPWTFFMPASLWLIFKLPKNNKAEKGLLGWIFFVLVFFSLCTGKRNLYILSVYPAASILLASRFSEIRSLGVKWQKTIVFPLLFILLIFGIACLFAVFIKKIPVSGLFFIPNGLILVPGVVLLFFLFQKNGLNQRWLVSLSLLLVITQFLVGVFVFPAFNPIKTPIALATAAKAKLPEESSLLMYQMNGEIMAFYSQRRGKRIDDIEELNRAVKNTGKGFIVISQNMLKDLKQELNFPVDINLFQMGRKKLAWLEYGYL